MTEQLEPRDDRSYDRPIGYLPAYELGRLNSGHSANLRSAKFGPSALDGDVPVYLAAQPTTGWVTTDTDAMHAHFESIYNGLEMSDRTSIIEGILRLAAVSKPHVQIPPENVHIDSDVSRKAGKVGTSAASKAEPVQQPDALARIRELERERDRALMAAEAEAREVDRLRGRQPERVPLIHQQIERAAQKLAEVMDYPWEPMPDQGRKTMRENALAVIEAAYGIQPAHKEQT